MSLLPDWTIDPDVARARTLPSAVYTDPAWLDAAKARVFAPSWQYLADADALRTPGRALPVTLGEGVEREDEVVVEGVQRGVASRLYDCGRYSPARESGVHHFHRLLTAALAGEGPVPAGG